MLVDRFGRRFTYLRLSVTEACNFRCTYCLPNGYQCPAKVQRPLNLEEITNLAAAFSKLGFTKIRLTGGEPTIRRDIAHIVTALAQTSSINTIALTTNGYRLARIAADLKAAGLTNVNISIDSLVPKRFSAITGWDFLSQVLDGVSQALMAGLVTKVNTVLLKETYAEEMDSFLGWLELQPVTLRFIELMQTAGSAAYFKKHHVKGESIKADLEARGWTPVARCADAGPAQEYSHPSYRGRVGIIAPYSKGFCSSCNRLRISCTGGLRLCLFGNGEDSLRPLLQRREQLPEVVARITALIGGKAKGHDLANGNYGSIPHLASIGG